MNLPGCTRCACAAAFASGLVLLIDTNIVLKDGGTVLTDLKHQAFYGAYRKVSKNYAILTRSRENQPHQRVICTTNL